MKEYLILLAQQHERFRVTELQSLAELYNVKVDFGNHDLESPFLVVKLENDTEAVNLVRRAVLARSVYELYAVGDDLDGLHKSLKANYSQEYWRQYDEDTFKFDIVGYQGSKKDKREQVAIFESFRYMDLQGPIKMKNPQHVFTVLEDYEFGALSPKRLFFGRYLTDSHRKYVDKLDLKKRSFIGTTSFEAELATATCNIAKLTPGKFMYDPFVGTGSFLVSAGLCGAMSVGSDIDVRQIRGKNGETIQSNFSQYGFANLFLDVMTMDFTHNALRPSLKFDAIVCDPPYGVREGLRVLGARDPEKAKGKKDVVINGELAYMRRDYVHPKKPYQFDSLLDDLLGFASERLVEHGRLCFWMPTALEDYTETDIPLHPDLELRANCEQQFHKWSRRLLVYDRRPYGETGESMPVTGAHNEEFRDKYFRGFR